jgi:hypothetical protein
VNLTVVSPKYRGNWDNLYSRFKLLVYVVLQPKHTVIGVLELTYYTCKSINFIDSSIADTQTNLIELVP